MSHNRQLVNLKDTHVLVTCGGGLQGMTLFKSIAALDGVVSHLFDINEENVSRYFYDFFYRSTTLSNIEQYEKELTEYCSRYSVDYIVPATQYGLIFLAQRKKYFSEVLNCKIAVPEEDWANIFIDKREAHAFLMQQGFRVQNEENPLTSDNYPLIGKPVNGWGGKGMVVVQSRSDFSKGNYKPKNYLWTRFIKDFKEYSIDFAVNHLGEVSSPVVRERLSVSGGFALVSQSVSVSEAYIYLIGQAFSYPAFSGLYNLQFITTSEGDFFTDLNPRLGTSAVMGEYFHSNPIAHLLGKGRKSTYPKRPVKVVRYLEEKYFPIEDPEQNVENQKVSGDSYSVLKSATEEGRKIGREEAKMEIARAMKKEGFAISQIIRISGLSQILIEKLK